MNRIANPIVLHPGEGKGITIGSSRLCLKLFGEAASNKLSITEYELSPKFPGPPLHKHKVFEHAWYVLEGELTVQLNNEILALTKGGFISIPKLIIHGFANQTDAVVKILAVDTPGGFEKYYDDLQAAFGDGTPIDQEVMRSIQLKYDTYSPDYEF